MVEVRGTRLERWGISFSTPTFGFSTFVESIAKRLRNVDEFAEYRSTSRILLFFPHFRSPTFDLSFPLRMQVKRVPAPFVVGISTRPRAHGRRETGWAISFRGRESCSTRRRPVPNIFQVCMALSTIRYFNIDTLSSIYRAAREIRRAVGTYLYEFHFGWLYSALLPQRSPAKRPKRGGTHFDVHVLRFR